MAKITINEKEYYTDDFNEDQVKAYNEIVFCDGERQRLSYNLQLLNDRVDMLSRVITEKQDESNEKT